MNQNSNQRHSMIKSFIDSLNAKEMPKMGYKWHDGKWMWPEYDWDNHEYSDFETSSHVENQFRRLGKYKFKEANDAANSKR